MEERDIFVKKKVVFIFKQTGGAATDKVGY